MNVDDLYALPLSEFTKARNALAKETGDKDIAKLKKPNAAAWALNQAARSNKGDVARFLHAAARLRTSAARDTLDDLRAAEADVRRAALKHGRPSMVNEVNALLAAAAADQAVAALLEEGRLTGDEESGEVVLTPVKGGKPPRKDEVRAARENKERKAREEARRKYDEAADKAKELDAEADRLERDASEAEDKAARLRSRAETAREKADKAQAKADDLKAALD